MDDYDVNGDNATDFQDGEPIRDLKGRTEIANFELRACHLAEGYFLSNNLTYKKVNNHFYMEKSEWQDREVSVP